MRPIWALVATLALTADVFADVARVNDSWWFIAVVIFFNCVAIDLSRPSAIRRALM